MKNNRLRFFREMVAVSFAVTLFFADLGYSQYITQDSISPKYGSSPQSVQLEEQRLQNRLSMPEYGSPQLPYQLPEFNRSFPKRSILEPGFPNPETWRAMPSQNWCWQVLPSGLIYTSYLAGPHEPRSGTYLNHDSDHGGFWDFTLGGRAGLIRYGSKNSILPCGFQLDVEAAAIGRMDLEHEHDMMATDYRFGFPITFGNQNWQFKFGYYHVSSHLGDEYMIVNNTWHERINYYRENLVFGITYRPDTNWRFYAEAGYAMIRGEYTEPWEFQFGVEFSPMIPNGLTGSPFVAANVYLREENDFGGSFVLQAGWQWRGNNGHLFRIGVEWFNGRSEQYEFFRNHENRIGGGVWFDF